MGTTAVVSAVMNIGKARLLCLDTMDLYMSGHLLESRYLSLTFSIDPESTNVSRISLHSLVVLGLKTSNLK